MRHALFWVFQISTSLAVLLVFSVVIQESVEPARVSIEPSQEVLAESTHQFSPTSTDVPDPNELLKQVNILRKEASLPPLRADAQLEAIARSRAKDMQSADYYAHESPVDGRVFSDLLRQNSIVYSSACENLNLAFSRQSEALIDDWVKSKSGHKECLLDPYSSQAGYAVVAYQLDTKKAYLIVAIHLSE